LCSFPVGDDRIVVSGSEDATIRVWGEQQSVLSAHTGAVTALCPFPLGDTLALASASSDRTVRIWDLNRKALLATIPVHHHAHCCEFIDGALIVGLSHGLIAIDQLNLPG
jgi:WD40 repeat protein